MDEDKRLFVAAQLLPALILDREKERNYTRERAVEIAIQYTDLLISKLSSTTETSTTEQHNEIVTPISRADLLDIIQKVKISNVSLNEVSNTEKIFDKRYLIIERTDDGKLKRQGRLNSDGTVEWIREYQ